MGWLIFINTYIYEDTFKFKLLANLDQRQKMLNTLAYYLGYGASSAEEQEIQQSLHQEEEVSVDQFKISELKEENGWDLIEKKGVATEEAESSEHDENEKNVGNEENVTPAAVQPREVRTTKRSHRRAHRQALKNKRNMQMKKMAFGIQLKQNNFNKVRSIVQQPRKHY